jgi:hypothetical protein
LVSVLAGAQIAGAQAPAPRPLTGLKAESVALVDGNAKLTQEIVDSCSPSPSSAFRSSRRSAAKRALVG